MKVVETCTGSATPLVSGSMAPSAWAAMVRAFSGRGSVMRLSGTDHSRPRIACKTTPCKIGSAARYAPKGRLRGSWMASFFYYYAAPLAVGAVGLVLVLGLVNMMRGGSPNTSQRLMRLRVLLQFVAIIIVMATIWAMGR